MNAISPPPAVVKLSAAQVEKLRRKLNFIFDQINTMSDGLGLIDDKFDDKEDRTGAQVHWVIERLSHQQDAATDAIEDVLGLLGIKFVGEKSDSKGSD